MFNPKHRILLRSFPGEDRFVCLGSQLASIVSALKDFLPKHMWYGADVEAMGKDGMRYKSAQINLIGTDLDFIQYCTGISQFIWGVFLCMDKNFSSQNVEGVEVETEDDRFRSIACNGILLEIRTFDTTFFEIYSESEEIINLISKEFNSNELTSRENFVD